MADLTGYRFICARIRLGFRRCHISRGKSNWRMASVAAVNYRFKLRLDFGVLDRERSIAYGITGPLLRATGEPYDVRKDIPYLVYDRFDFEIPVADTCDCPIIAFDFVCFTDKRTGMCGRFAVTLPNDAMARLFAAQPANALPEVPNFNVCPTNQVHVVFSGDTGRRLVPMRWGFLPHWYTAPTAGSLLAYRHRARRTNPPA